MTETIFGLCCKRPLHACDRCLAIYARIGFRIASEKLNLPSLVAAGARSADTGRPYYRVEFDGAHPATRLPRYRLVPLMGSRG